MVQRGMTSSDTLSGTLSLFRAVSMDGIMATVLDVEKAENCTLPTFFAKDRGFI